jgi:hypothetical protein
MILDKVSSMAVVTTKVMHRPRGWQAIFLFNFF